MEFLEELDLGMMECCINKMMGYWHDKILKRVGES